MDYEKKYKEALSRAKNLYKDAIDMGENIRAKQYEIIFSELKESGTGDEKIRKVLIDMFKGYNIQKVGDFTNKEIIAWLEKQGEQKMWESVEPVTEDDKLHLIMNEQKTAWSKEDEEKMEFLIAMCDDEQDKCAKYSTMYRECNETKEWLKSLKDRMKGE